MLPTELLPALGHKPQRSMLRMHACMQVQRERTRQQHQAAAANHCMYATLSNNFAIRDATTMHGGSSNVLSSDLSPLKTCKKHMTCLPAAQNVSVTCTCNDKHRLIACRCVLLAVAESMHRIT
jgi:hypothetical protein